MQSIKNLMPLALLTCLLGISLPGVTEARSDHHSIKHRYNDNHHYYGANHHSNKYRHNRNRHYYGANHHNYSIGHRLSVLPRGYLSLSHIGTNYYYYAGSYLRHFGHDYVVVKPPIGIGISILPPGHRQIHIGRHTYYLANGFHYLWDDFRRSYVVVDAPYKNTHTIPVRTGVNEQYIYPKVGQSATQTSRDRYECYLWAVEQTGVEPAQVQNSIPGNGIDDYQRANGACLEARGYSVK